MITLFNREKLYVGNDPQDAARVWGALKAEHIPYEMDTLRSQPALVTGFHARMGMQGMNGNFTPNQYADQVTLTYVIYIRRADRKAAQAAVEAHPNLQ